MSLSTKFIILASIMMLILLVWSPYQNMRIIYGLILFLIVCYFLEAGREQWRKSQELSRTVNKLKTTCEELDENTKLIVKTDLELTKTQEELDEKISGFYTLHELGKKINRTFNEEELFIIITEALVFKLDFEKCLIMLIDEINNHLVCKAKLGYSEEEAEALDFTVIEEELMGGEFKEGKTILVKSRESAAQGERKLADSFGTSSFVVVPLVVKDQSCGFIVVGNNLPYRQVTEGDLDILSILASQTAGAIENARLYEQLWESYQDLERRVKERTMELAKANEELKRLNRMKSDFVSAVSHELRTPLTSIKGYASILIAGKLGEINSAVKQRLEKIDHHSNSLTKLVNDLLDISRIESGKVEMKIERLDINKVIESVVDVTTPQVKEKKIALTIEIPSHITEIWADQSQIERVFINLLSNAIKFTPVKGKISIEVSEKDEFVQIDTTDNGAGIDPIDLPRIFDEFYRSDNPINQKVKGTGLGLSLVRRIVEAHHGKIWATSKLNEGSTFSFTLPKKPQMS